MKNRTLADRDSLVKKASYLRLMAGKLADGMKSGTFRSLYRGQGIEFSGVRDYIRGDDVRSIDWNVTARMNKPFVKVFEEERELQIFIVVDSSLSMQLENQGKSKYEVCSETAALLTIASEINNCSLGAVFFDGRIYFSCKPEFGREQTMLILTHLAELPEDTVTGSVLGNALTGAGRLLKKRSLVFVLSDFRSEGWEKPIISLAQKNDVVAVNIKDKYDEELPELGTVPFVDIESGKKMILPSVSPKLKKEWKNHHENNLKKWQSTCLNHGIYPVVMNVTDDPLKILTSVFSEGRR